MTRVLSEALDRVASPDARESVIFMALADGGLTAVPDDLAVFRRFALGPLARAMKLSLGEEFADAVLTDLTPIIERAASSVTGANRGQSPVGLGLVVGTADTARATEWIQAAPEGTKTRVVDDVFDLVAGVEALSKHRLVVLLDCSLPSLRPTALSTLSRILPPTARVVLLGVGAQAATPEQWLCLPGDASVSDVAKAAFPEAESEAPPQAATSPQGPLQVLVIDEDATLRAAVAGHLRGAGMEVTTAPDAFVGLEIASDHPPHVIIVDGELKNLDGERFCGLVRRMFGPSGPAVVVFVGDRTRLVPGAADVLVKGADNHRLAEVVAAVRRR